MVAEGEGRKDAATHRLSGRGPRQPARALRPARAASEVAARATWSPSRSPTPPRTTWSPTATPVDVRRTRSGDAWEARTAAPAPAGVALGMPAIGVPAPLPDAPACR